MREVSLSKKLQEEDVEELFLKPCADKGDKQLKEFPVKKQELSTLTYGKAGVLGCTVLLIFMIFNYYYQTNNVRHSVSFFSMGSPDWPDSACPLTEPFGACDSASQKDGNVWASQVCRQNGFVGGVWTGRAKAGCNGRVAMFCDIDVTIHDENHCKVAFRYGCSAKKQTRIEIKCIE